MYKPVVTSDGNLHNISNDSDFFELLRNYLGDDSAEWYRERIMGVTELVEEIDGNLGNIVDRTLPSGTVVYDTNRLEQLDKEKLIEVAIVAHEIAGWDQW